MNARGAGFWLLVAAAVVIAATVVAAIVVMGSPAVQRERRMDETRVQQLMQIERAVRMVHEREGRLPAELSALAREPGLGLALSDPHTAARYGYRTKGPNAFQLCAVFARDSAVDQRRARFEPGLELAWRHPAGNHCFAFRIDPAKR
jgi:hypothetical protein